MTAPAIDPQSIEHLSHAPSCECNENPAAFYVDQHGCRTHLLCDPCLEYNRERFARESASHGGSWCDYCGGFFAIFDALVKVVPL